jgi:glycosyltransferase involved in cell wall biosynthesis
LSAPPLLSVGVPVYNGERFLADALESALGQEYPNLEVLISDNASTDSTPDICRRFKADSRVRYSRSPETTEPIANFGRVLGMARGEYFTWLAHDDVLTSPSYAATLVETLEANPDAVLCASALEAFRDDDPQARSVIFYERLAAGSPWPEARRALFRWPPDEWETLVYGIFRRDALQRHFSANPSFRMPLQRLAFTGRFVIVPSNLRGFRLHQGSLAQQRGTRSELALLIRGVTFKWRLLMAAVRSPAPLAHRIWLSGVAGRNFLTNHVAWAHSVPQQTSGLEEELAVLAAAAEERAALIRRNGGRLPERSTVEPIRRRRRRLEHWFRRPSVEDVHYLIELNARVGEGRRICDELLAAIEAPALDR